jgi:hypothetical protein
MNQKMYLIMIIYYLIEIWFNQIKHTLKLNKKVLKFNELKLEVKKSIRMVKTRLIIVIYNIVIFFFVQFFT